jgi:hypothetical protein
MTKPITPLRQRMLDDMALRNMSPATQRVYISAVKNFSEPGKPFKPNRKRYYVGVTVRNRSDTVGEIGSLVRGHGVG